MDRQEKGASPYLFLAVLTLAFLAAAVFMTFGSAGTKTADYTVTTERTADGEIAPVRTLVDINTATAEELETLTGIGPALAKEIVAYREAHGDFTSAEELLNVKGIGNAKLEGLRGEITIGGNAP